MQRRGLKATGKELYSSTAVRPHAIRFKPERARAKSQRRNKTLTAVRQPCEGWTPSLSEPLSPGHYFSASGASSFCKIANVCRNLPFTGVSRQADADRSSATVPLKAAQLQEHPEFPYLSWDLTPTQKGHVSVASGRGGPFKVAYEVHGHGPRHLVVRRRSLYSISFTKLGCRIG